MIKHLSLLLPVLFGFACGGPAKEASSSSSEASSGEDMCPKTPAEVRKNCGCRPTEKHYVSMATQMGEGKDEARACATGQNPGDKMTKCMNDMGTSNATIALYGPPINKDDDFDKCLAAHPAP